MSYSKVLKKHSRTFYYSSLLFPKRVRNDVSLLYSFVRYVDNLVDRENSNLAEIENFQNLFENAWSGKRVKNKLVNDFVSLAKSKNFSKNWIDDFFRAQKQDFKKRNYKTFQELQSYTYGVAGTIGLFLCKILDLPNAAFDGAVKLGQSMQIINCCRDVFEDYRLGRVYIPAEDVRRFNIKLEKFLDKNSKEGLVDLIGFEIKRAFKIEKEARRSFSYFKNKRSLLAVMVASDLYHLIGEKILNDLEIIYSEKKRLITFFDFFKIVLRDFFIVYF